MERENIGFVMYRDYQEYFGFLSNEEKGILLDAIFDYAFGSKVPEGLSRVALLAFAFIKNQIDRDLDKYEKKCEKNRRNGSQGGRPPKASQSEEAKTQSSSFAKADEVRAAEDSSDDDVYIPEDIREGFEDFWGRYPKKTEKESALYEYALLSPDEGLRGEILSGLAKFKNSDGWKKEGGRYVPKASYWLSRREWERAGSIGPPERKEPLRDRYTRDDAYFEEFFNEALERSYNMEI